MSEGSSHSHSRQLTLVISMGMARVFGKARAARR